MFKSESSAPVMPPMENKITDAPAVMAESPLHAAENFNAPPREYYRPSIAGDVLEQQRADAVRKELRGEISLRRHEQNLRTAAARVEAEKAEAERIARLEAYKLRPKTWEEKYKLTMNDGPSRSPKFICHLIEAQGVQGKLDSTLKKIRAQLVEYEKLNTERRQLGGRAAASLFREKYCSNTRTSAMAKQSAPSRSSPTLNTCKQNLRNGGCCSARNCARLNPLSRRCFPTSARQFKTLRVTGRKSWMPRNAKPRPAWKSRLSLQWNWL